MELKNYKEKCRQRWYGAALFDSIENWKRWEENKEYLIEAMRHFVHNPFQSDGNKCYNSDGSLYSFLWNCQAAIQPDKRRLDPFLDFEEYYQKVFLRRGLIIYCEGLIEEIESESPRDIPLFDESKNSS